MKKLMVFGCNGFVGTNLCIRAKKLGWRISGAGTGAQPAMPGLAYVSCDIRNREAVMAAVRAAKPDFVVNAAAIADIDFAQVNREQAFDINVVGAENIAAAAHECGARNLFFSSDAVFDGISGGYMEDSATAYVNYYGQTKCEAERRVLSACANSVVVRISLVLGFSDAKGNSALDTMARRFAAGQPVLCNASDIRTPIDVSTLCACVLELYEKPFCGVIHLGSTEHASRCEIAKKVARLLGYSEELVAIAKASDPGKAPRHKKGILCVTLAQSLLDTPLCDLDATLKNAVAGKPVENSISCDRHERSV